MKRSIGGPLVSGDASSAPRPIKLASLVRSEVGRFLAREVELPKGVLVTIAKVQVAGDLSLARLGLSVLPFAQGQKALAVINAARSALRRVLYRRLRLYRIPKVEFYLDSTEERAYKIEQLLDNLDEGGG